jgi:glycosyltransferase involved in cell wall biosynthesis
VAKILLITPEVPYPPEQGASIRNFFILKGLARNHQVSLFSASRLSGETMDLAGSPLSELCDSIRIAHVPERDQRSRLARLLTLNTPDLAGRFQGEGLIRSLVQHLNEVKETEDRYNIVQIEGLELAHLIPVIRYHFPSARVLYDAHNAETELQRRALDTDLANPKRWPAALYSFVQVRRLDHYESWTCESADRVTTVSDGDAKHLARYLGGAQPAVIPNCIDFDSYQELSSQEAVASDILFMGKMDYRPNVDAVLWFAEKIWPLLLEKDSDLQWFIVGQKPHLRLEALKSSPGITITGYVGSVLPYLQGAKLMVLPLRMGSGTRLKLLEALASSTAVVSTSIGAEGYPGIGEEAVLIRDDPAAFAEAVLDLLRDEEKRGNLGRRGREYAAQYDWRKVIPGFDAVYQELLS